MKERNENGNWSREAKERAMYAFVTGDVAVHQHFYEVYDYDELIKHETCQKIDSSGKVIGVLMPCPVCKTNESVEPHNPERHVKSQHLRTPSFGVSCSFVTVMKYVCFSSSCPDFIKKVKKKIGDSVNLSESLARYGTPAKVKAAKMGRTWSSWTEEGMSVLPTAALKIKYGKEGATLQQQGGYMRGLPKLVLNTEAMRSETHHLLEAAFAQRAIADMHGCHASQYPQFFC